MLLQLIFMAFLFRCCLMGKNHSDGICEKVNLCRKNERCHPVVMECHHTSCRYRRFNTIDNRHLIHSRWFYDSYYQRCRRYNNHVENFVYFRFLRDCVRLCPVVRRKRNEQIITLHISERPPSYNDTVYVQMHIDTSPGWVQNLTDWMNISTGSYNAQVHYFQNYRRRFTSFLDPMHQLMLSHPQSLKEKNY